MENPTTSRLPWDGLARPETPSFVQGLPIEEYLATPHSASPSGLATFIRRSPAHWLAWRTERLADTAAQRDGTLSHLTLLQPELFRERYHVLPEGVTRDVRHEKYRAQLALACDLDYVPDQAEAKVLLESGAGRILVKPGEVEEAQKVADAVRRHPRWKTLIERAESVSFEPTLFWADEEYPGIVLRCRPDVLALHADGLIVAGDLKTCPSAHPDRWARAAWESCYGISAHMFQEGVRANFGGRAPAVVYWAAERGVVGNVVEAYPLGLADAPTQWTIAGKAWYRRALAQFAACLESDRWPSYRDGRIEALDVPHYVTRELEALEADLAPVILAETADALGEEATA